MAAGFRDLQVKNRKKWASRLTTLVRSRCSRSHQPIQRPIYRVIRRGPPQLLVVMNDTNERLSGPDELKITATGEVIEQRGQETGKLAGVFPVELDGGTRGKRGKFGTINATLC